MTTAPSAPAPAQVDVSLEFAGLTGNDAVIERMRPYDERFEARARTDDRAASTKYSGAPQRS